MDAEAVGAALTTEALAPPIAQSLGLSVEAVKASLALLAEGAQPAFVARYRPERIQKLSIRDLERVQALAAKAVAFELKRQELIAEVRRKHADMDHVIEHLKAAKDQVDLDDVRALLKRRKRGPAAKARAAGLGPVATALWTFAVPETKLAELVRPERESRVSAPPREPIASGDVELNPAEESPSAEPTEMPQEAEVASAEAVPAEPSSAEQPTDITSEIPAEATSETQAPLRSESTENSEEASEASASASGTEPSQARPPEPPLDPEAVVAKISADAVGDDATALAGARAICVDQMSDHPRLRRALRELLLAEAVLSSRVVPEKAEKANRYAKFVEFSEPCNKISTSNLLALHRGEREGVLRVSLDIDPDRVVEVITTELEIDIETAPGQEIRRATVEAWSHALGKLVRNGVRKLLKHRADAEAINEYCTALRPLLMAPAFGRRPVLAIDPGHQNGCRIAALDSDGKMLVHDTVFPLSPKLQVPQAKARIAELCGEHHVAAIVVANGSSGREVERMCRELVRETETLKGVVVTSIDADAAALHGSSRAAKDEFQGSDAALRRAVSAGRRVQDPLLELIKIDTRKLGLGQHQHEVDQEELRTALEQVTVSCVSEVGVDVNRVSEDVLPWVAGMSHALAKAVVGFRESRGGVRSRAQLLEVPGFAGKAFEQAAGFIQIYDGDQPLDATLIHPERYGQVTEMAREVGVPVAELLGNEELIGKIPADPFLGKPGVSGEPLGEPSFAFVIAQLRKPTTDPRPEFCTVEFHPDLNTFEDLSVSMELDGIVTHLAAFGAFVDVGIVQEGLVHVSELSHEFISSPLEAVHVGQRVRGVVIEISPERKRFSLSLKALLPKPERGSRPNRSEGKPRRKGGPNKGRGGKKDQKRGGNKERTLGFRLDLSELASRLEKG